TKKSSPRPGRIRRARLPLSLEQLEDRTLLAVTAALTNDAPWVAVGPQHVTQPANDPILNVIGITNDVSAGAVVALAPSPTDPNILYAGTANGGVWKTANAGSSSPHWVPLTDQAPSLAIGALALSPLDANVLYAGTGSFSNFQSAGGEAVGVLKSTDGGQTWTLFGQNDLRGLRIDAIVPTSIIDDGKGPGQGGQVVLAATADQDDSGPQVRGGIYRSDDGGVTWTRLSGDKGLPSAAVTDLALDAAVPTGRVYAGIPGKGVYVNDNAGRSGFWSPVDPASMPGSDTSTRIRLAVAPGSGNNAVYA